MSGDRIRELNDAFRRTFSGGTVMLSASVAELPDMVKAEALHRTATYDAFTADNDPHGEHDFGSFELVGRKFFWKIDYYDADCCYGSENPSDPHVTTRVLTHACRRLLTPPWRGFLLRGNLPDRQILAPWEQRSRA